MHLNCKAKKALTKTYIFWAQVPSLMALWNHFWFSLIWFSFLFGNECFPGLSEESAMKWGGFKLMHNSLMFLKFQLILGNISVMKKLSPLNRGQKKKSEKGLKVLETTHKGNLPIFNEFCFSVIKANIKTTLPLLNFLLSHHKHLISGQRQCENWAEN